MPDTSAPGTGSERHHRTWRPAVHLDPPPLTGIVAYGGLVALVMTLAAAGVLPRWPGLLHLVALPPLGLFADVRWLLTHTTGHWWFVLGITVAVALRTLVLALLAGEPGAPRWRLAIGAELVALLPALIAGTADFVAHAALYSRLAGANMLALGAAFVLLAGVPWQRRLRYRDAFAANLRAGLHVPDLAAYAALLLMLGGVAAAAGEAGRVLLVPISGLVTLVAVMRLRAPGPRAPLRWLLVAVVVALAVAVTVIITRGEPWPTSQQQRPGSVLLMSGINSASGEGAIFELRPERLGYHCGQVYYFSYADTGDGQPQGDAACEIRTGAPYVPEHTQRPFEEQVELLAAQARDLDPPVVVFAHSQAAWVAWDAAAAGLLDPVEQLVLVGPFPSSPAGFPPPGETGPGRVGGDLFRALEPALGLVDFDFEVDAPLTHELLATPDAASNVFSQPLPTHVDALSVAALPDLALMPDRWRLEGADDACPLREAHPYLPITPGFYRTVDDHLAGRPTGDCGPWPEAYRLVTQPLGSAAYRP